MHAHTHVVCMLYVIHAHIHIAKCAGHLLFSCDNPHLLLSTGMYMYALIFVTRLVCDSMRIALSLLEILLVHVTKCGLAILHNDHATRWIG